MSAAQQQSEALEQEIRTLQERLGAIRARDNGDRNKAFVGRCFKYRNSYSLPQGGKDDWYLYMKVAGVDDDDGMPFGLSFQTDQYGQIEIHPRDRLRSALLDIEIESEEFRTAWENVMQRVIAAGGS